jgi:Ca2+-binding RTX toxin-like protein
MKRKMARVVAVGALMVALFATAAYAATVGCTGGPCSGTNNNDTITGSAAKDRIDALGGADTVTTAGAKNDTVYGRGAGDRIEGGDDDDTLYGNKAQDTVTDRFPLGINNDTDTLYGGKGDDTLNANDGDSKDTVNGGVGFDVCIVEGEDDRVGCNDVQVP